MLLVALIWAAVGYRFFSFVDGDKNIAENANTPKVEQLPSFKKDTFQLHSNFRDPFLGKTFHTQRTTENRVRSRVSKPPVAAPKIETPPIPFPELTHIGIVNNTTNNLKTHMISIEGTTYMVTKLGKYGSVEVVDIQKNLVKIKFNNEIKTFRP